ncbi:Crp/Fnr family transcriptional regulator [Myceligenerans halotolerans]
MRYDAIDPDSPAEGCGCVPDAGFVRLVERTPPWAPQPGVPQERERMTTSGTTRPGAANDPERLWCMAEVDIFADLDEREMDAMAQAAPMTRYPAGTLVYTPHEPVQTLFILKKGRVRIFRLSADGRALTTAIISPGTIFGEMAVLGQQMHGSFAEAMDDVVVCVMTTTDVRRLLLGDPRIAARISETLGRRIGDLERRLSDAVFKSVPQRVAGTLATLADSGQARPLTRGVQVRLTHEQVAALAGTSRETTTKVLGELADRDLITLGRGRIVVLDRERLALLAEGA